VVRRGVFLAAGLFALGILVIVGNTIRLDIENRRDEIEVTKLVGGSDAFVRRPFLYNGTWYGIAGGLTAGIIVAGIVGTLESPVQRIAGLYGSSFELQGVGAVGWLALLAGGAALGWLGSFIVATRELREIEPK
jgi:cell division transport system permease protein